ncbi:hypothetical protein VTN96DRAFT_5443 [Rasamsonia emersonii]
MSITSPPALTTTFTPAPSCLRDTYVWNATVGHSCGFGSSTVPCVYASLGPPSTSACLPPGYNWDTTAYFSPGICPSGYEIACESVVSIGSVSETRATCCPVGYTCQSGTDWPWYSTDRCASGLPGVVPFTYTSTTDSGWVTLTTTVQAGLNAYGIYIRWQSTDFLPRETLSPSSTASVLTSSSASAPVTTTAVSTAVSTFEAIPETAPSGLSSGAKAGIGVGSAVAFLLLVLIGLLIYRMFGPGRRDSSSQKNIILDPSDPGHPQSQGPMMIPVQNYKFYELSSSPMRRELDSRPKMSTAAQQQLHELPGTMYDR